MAILENSTAQAGEDIFGFGDSFVNGPSDGNREGVGLFARRRGKSLPLSCFHSTHVVSDENVQIFGRARNGPAAPPETTTHPLLLNASLQANRTPSGQSRSARQAQRIISSGTNDLLHTIEGLIGEGAVQMFHHIMTRGRGGGAETIRLDVPAGALVHLDRAFLQQRRPQGLVSAVRVERASHPGESRSQGREFDPLLTLQRWAEESKILHGDFAAERAGKLANHVALALLPAAVEAAKQAKVKEEAELAQQREAEAKAEAEAAEERARAEELAQQESLNASSGGAEESSQPELVTRLEVDMESEGSREVVSPPPDVDTEMVDASVPSPSSGPVGISTAEAPIGNDTSVAEGPSESESGQAGSSTLPERVTVMIHGSAVDITDTGIDPTFLEALPDDMREEVINQHVRDQRASRVERPPDSQISSEFLDALPPEIRAEIIQQERIEQARRRAAQTAPTGQGQSGVPADIDPASFIASLDPQLRQVVLLDQDDGFLQSLPSHMIAEAGVYREGQPRRHIAYRSNPPLPHGITTAQGLSLSRKLPGQHDAIQLLDKTGIAVLVRLLFFPQVLRKNLLFKVLVNLCENSKTRTELFNLLLNILQDGTGDLAAVDKSFAQMSFRNSKPQTPKSAGKQRAGSDYFSALPNSQNEAVPDLIAQRCLEGLTFIVTANELASLFFLTEHELPVGLRRAVSKKGKGKEKQLPQSHYPIVLLLGLLDRQSLLRTPSIMESVVGLLATVTRPLASLKDNKKTLESAPDTASASMPTNPSGNVAGPVDANAVHPDPPVVAPLAPGASSSVPADEPPQGKCVAW